MIDSVFPLWASICSADIGFGDVSLVWRLMNEHFSHGLWALAGPCVYPGSTTGLAETAVSIEVLAPSGGRGSSGTADWEIPGRAVRARTAMVIGPATMRGAQSVQLVQLVLPSHRPSQVFFSSLSLSVLVNTALVACWSGCAVGEQSYCPARIHPSAYCPPSHLSTPSTPSTTIYQFGCLPAKTLLYFVARYN